jgi:hypothetical protein
MPDDMTFETQLAQNLAALGKDLWQCIAALDVGIYAAQDPDALDSLRVLLVQQCTLLLKVHNALGDLHESVRLHDPATLAMLDTLLDESPQSEN